MHLLSLTDYELVYYSIIIIFLVIGKFFDSYKLSPLHKQVLTIIMIAILAILVGSRPLDVGADTKSYYNYSFLKIHGKSIGIILKQADWGSDSLFSILGIILYTIPSYTFFLTAISFIIFTTTYKSVSLLTKEKSCLFAFIYVIITAAFINTQFNIIRQGLALPFVLMFFYYILSPNIGYRGTICALIAIGFHFSSLIPILVGLSIKFIKFNDKFFSITYVTSIVLSFIGYGMHLLLPILGISHRAINLYLNSNTSVYRVGFRPDFIAFNTIFLILFFWLKPQDELTKGLIKIYMLCSSIFFLWTYIPYSDRVGIFSWILIPIIFYLCIKNTPLNIKFKYGLGFLFLLCSNAYLLF